MSGMLLSRVSQDYSEDCLGLDRLTSDGHQGHQSDIRRLQKDGDRWLKRGRDGMELGMAKADPLPRQLSRAATQGSKIEQR